MKHLLPLAIFAIAASPAVAALSPFYDSGEQVRTILSSAAVADELHQMPVHALERTGIRDDGAIEWTVRTEACDLVVHLIPVPPPGAGKTTYTLDLTDSCE